MDDDLAQKLEQFHREVTKAGEDVVFRRFPHKILQLGELLKTLDDPTSPFHVSNTLMGWDPTVYSPFEAPGEGHTNKKRKLEDEGFQDKRQVDPTTRPRYHEHIKANDHMTTKVYVVMKKECEELCTLTEKVRLWVTLTLPRIEDGDNFGVQVQEEVLAEVQRAQECGLSIRDLSRQDHLGRAKICCKLIKYPYVEDYALALREHDEKHFFLARQHIHDIRNVYATITDMIQKNISKIRVPKGNNSAGLY